VAVREGKAVAKIVLECEVEIEGPERIEAVEVKVMRGRDWQSVLLFALSRPQGIRDGKHLRISAAEGTVVKVGGELVK